MLTIRISQNHTRFNLEAITDLEYIHLEFMLLHLDLFKDSWCCVFIRRNRDLIIQGQLTRHHRQYLHDFIDRESDLLVNSLVSLEVNYKIVKTKPKIEEKIPM